ncbi:MAG: TldD/PmbA family protein, partial [Candidatus Zixiibacteriota bacterium]
MSQWTRRKFIKASAQGLAMASIPVFFKGNPFAAFTLPPTGSSKLTDYYEHFGVTETDIREVIAAGLGHGGDFCDVYFEHSISNYVGLQDKAVNKAYSDIDCGAG